VLTLKKIPLELLLLIMNRFLRNNIVPLITLTVLITVGIQVYWNIENYQYNKKQLINTIQITLDNSINNYYNDKAKLSLIDVSSIKSLTTANHPLNDSVKIELPNTTIKPNQLKTLKNKVYILNSSGSSGINAVSENKNIQLLAEKMILTVRNDSVDLAKIAAYLNDEFTHKQLNFDYALLYKKEGKMISKYHNPKDKKFLFTSTSKSTYLPESSELKLFFPDVFFKALKKGMIGIILSLILSLTIISSLFYLLHIIRQQKQLAIIKNDFISNISHELKTPIAVVTSALEAIENFNTANEPEKTKRYLAISNQHLIKLHQIVEKILETSILESDKLQLQKENTNINELILHNIEKLQFNTEKKNLLHLPKQEVWAKVDTFHFENAISNLIDNAIKYGGNEITISLKQENNMVLISVSDNGPGIDKSQRSKIFDKFYRVPQFNQHDQKGFGIGLYYSRNIIIKHGGTLTLTSEELTTFKISIPNEPED
jgi:signal transduction histidine kinase